MKIQFTVPDEHLAAAKAFIKTMYPINADPSDDDVLAYISSAIITYMSGLFPTVVLTSQAANVNQIATLQAQVRAATLAAMNFQVVQ